MSSIESLKEQARRHEQKEEWLKALNLYGKAIDKLDEAEQPDIGLHNRVGDLHVRLGNTDGAMRQYERAIELYMESELPNNAIAVCKKVLRNIPERPSIHLRIGQIRASQGFLVDARSSFLTYAEAMQKGGDIEAAYAALGEFADLAPDDTDLRLMMAAQMEQHGHVPEAVEQLQAGYRSLMMRGHEDDARVFEERIRELDPEAEIPDVVGLPAGAAGGFETTSLGGEDPFAAFGEIQLGEATPGAEPAEEEEVAEVGGFDIRSDEEAPQEAAAASVDEGPSEFEIGGPAEPGAELPPSFALEDEREGAAPEAEEEAESLPTFGLEAEEEEEAEPLPTLGLEAEEEEEAEPLPTFGLEAEEEEEESEALPTFGLEAEEEEEEAEPLPTLGPEEEEEDEGEPLPTFGLKDEEEPAEPLPVSGLEAEEEEEAEPLPTFGLEHEEPAAPADSEELDAAAFGVRDLGEREDREYVDDLGEMAEVKADLALEASAAEAREAAMEDAAAEKRAIERDALGHESLAERGDLEGAMKALRRLLDQDPDDLARRQRMVEYAFRTGKESVLTSAYLELAEALERAGQESKARSVYQQVLSTEPQNERARAALGGAEAPPRPMREVASSEEYVDLGSLILGDEEDEKSTRFVVAYEEPSGDEQADFARMLRQFKAKVAETFSADDVRAHHDLGTAYKEMGLLDEAIGEYQQALRASSDHLPTYEMLGQCFLEKGENQAAARTLARALDVRDVIEDDLLGIYYYLGTAYEALGNTASALEFYDKVFALDINFADVTERLRALR